jgi:hypothetical protein
MVVEITPSRVSRWETLTIHYSQTLRPPLGVKDEVVNGIPKAIAIKVYCSEWALETGKSSCMVKYIYSIES